MQLKLLQHWKHQAYRAHTRGQNKFFWSADHKWGNYQDHRVQISTSTILWNVLHPRLDVATVTDFPVVHHRGRSRAGCSHMTSDLPLGSQWGSILCLGSSCPLMWWLQAVGFAWTHHPWHCLPLDMLHYSYSPIQGGERKRIWKRKHEGSRPSQITRNFCLTSIEVADTGIEQGCCFFCFFLKNWIWKQDWRSMGIPPRLNGDCIHCKVIGESMWFPWFGLPLWKLILTNTSKCSYDQYRYFCERV